MSVTAAQGFLASGVAAGIKTSQARDVALVVNTGPEATAAAVFTTNRMAAAPVRHSREAIAGQSCRAVILNSGGANACTGAQGAEDTRRTAEKVADLCQLPVHEVQVCSTGMIGVPLPMQQLLVGIEQAHQELSPDGGPAAAEAIMTTDTVSKNAVAQGQGFTVGGMAKGAGMLAPEMATMLCVVTTDAQLSPEQAQEALAQAVKLSFNRVDADGCMSTNDTVVLLANGASGQRPDPAEFQQLLTHVCLDLAHQMVADAEGAEHRIEIRVEGAASEADAEEVARAISRSVLFKTAIYGKDPNWGRILSAIGTCAADFDADNVDVQINGVRVCRASQADQPRDAVDFSSNEVEVVINLHAGAEQVSIYTMDLTHGYVEENSAYSS